MTEVTSSENHRYYEYVVHSNLPIALILEKHTPRKHTHMHTKVQTQSIHYAAYNEEGKAAICCTDKDKVQTNYYNN